MNVLFVGMAQSYYRAGADRPAGLGTAGPDPEDMGWAPDILRELMRRGHRAVLVGLVGPASMAARFGALPVSEVDDGGLTRVFSSSPRGLRDYVVAADAVVLRKDYGAYRELFRGVRMRRRPVATILTTVDTGRLRFRPRRSPFTVLVNDPGELAAYRRRGVRTEIFSKPASALFYERPASPVDKVFDLVQVMHNTDRARKRFDLLLAGLVRMDALTSRPIHAAVVGNTETHADAIAAVNERCTRVVVTSTGWVPHRTVYETMLRARTTVVTSSRDANPRVIAESMACDVPVACATDLTGGRFQINPETGELFAPEPDALARTLLAMLSRPDRYHPRSRCITIGRAADQLESVLQR